MGKALSFKDATLKFLDEPRNIYYAGQVIHGQIEYEVAHNKVDFSGIYVNFVGEGTVYWTERESEESRGVKRYKQVEYKNREEYFNETVPLLPGLNSLPRGKHTLDFSFQIPYNVPSTFKSEIGKISYHAVAYIDYADSRYEREKISKEFEVVAPLNLDTEEGRRPINLEFEEMYSCCCSSSPMSIKIHIPQTGFVPGQAIPIIINADNQTNTEVKKIVFQLIKKVAYRSQRPTSEFIGPQEVLETLKTGPILAKRNREIRYEMTVPPMIAVNLDNCEIIDYGYGLKVTVKLTGCKDDLEDETEIILGVVPIPGWSPNSEDFVHPMAHSLPIAPVPTPPPETAKVSSYQQMGVKVFPNANVAFKNVAPTQSSPFPSNPGYPTNPSPYPTNPTPYPTNPTPYPTNPTPYPTNPSPYPTNPSPYPTNPTPYPTNPTPYPPNPSPYPTNPSPYPTNPSPYPTNPSPYPTNPTPYPNSLNLVAIPPQASPRHVGPGYPLPAPYPPNNSLSPGGFTGPSAPPL